MRRLSPFAWIVLFLALFSSGLMVAKISPLVTSPPVLRAIERPSSSPRWLGLVELVLAMNDGVHLYTQYGAWWLKPDLTVVKREWPRDFDPLSIEAIAVHPPEVALLLANDRGRSGTDTLGRAIVIVTQERTERVSIPFVDKNDRMMGLHAVEEGYEVFICDAERQTFRSVRFSRNGVETAHPVPISVRDYVDDVIWRDNTPLAVLERHGQGRHWVELVDFAGRPQRLLDGVSAVRTTSNLEVYSEAVSFLDRHGAPVPLAKRGHLFFVVVEDEVLPLDTDPYPVGESETVFSGRRLAVRESERGTDVRATASTWRTIASERKSGLTPFPVGGRWLVTDTSLERALVVDANGNRLDRIGWRDNLARKTRHPSAGWIALLFALASATMASLFITWRARRLLRTPAAGSVDRPGSTGIFVGKLSLPAGALLQSTGRRVRLIDGAEVHVGATRVALCGKVRRSDVRPEVPLVDGDAVYVVGRLESTSEGGPFRATGALRFGGDIAIGRSDLDKYDAQQATLASRTVLRVALVHLLLGAVALYHFGLAPASW